jgi:hypothetical protein
LTQSLLSTPWMLPPPKRRVVVGFSGGVTSAWCAGWALRTYPREEVVLLFHDTKEEHPDTYRFLREMAAALDMPITERSDGRSVTEVFHDEGFLGNNQNAMCSRILKMEQGDKYFEELRSQGVTEIVKVLGFSAREVERVQRGHARALKYGYTLRLPIVEEKVTKQATADWCAAMGVRPSAMYEWADHANCVGCVKGGRAYFLAVREHHPDVFEQRAALEEEFGHPIIRGGDRERVTLRELAACGLKRPVGLRERIEIGPCECGD